MEMKTKMKIKRRLSGLGAMLLCAACLLGGCRAAPLPPDGTEGNTSVGAPQESAAEVDSSYTEIPGELEAGVNTLSVKCTEGTDGCWSFSGGTLTFSGLSADTVCSLSGEFDGQIVIDAGEDFQFELELCGVTLYNAVKNPIEILAGDKVTITAKKDSTNYIYDKRAALPSDSEEHSAAIYAACDLDLRGKGELTVISADNNGIHTKDDLSVKNITLAVTCADNALKGNDGVKIEGGVLTLIARQGDGIKTSNTDVSKKGNQRGSIVITGGTVNIYAACDGIDAAYNAEIGDEAILNIYTDRYSPYSEDVETPAGEDVRYIRFTSQNYSYSVKYYNSDSDYVWVNATYYKSVSGGRSTYYYYAFDKRTDYASFQLFIYSNGQQQGQEEAYAAKSDYLTWNGAYDTFALESRGGSLSYGWNNYSASEGGPGMGGPGGPGGPGGMGGMTEGNRDKSDHSAKGIKAGNEVLISGGTVFVQAYDDAIHANSETALENGAAPTGNVTVTGGTLTLSSKDDGIHADGVLTVEGGVIRVTESYEGLEGTRVVVRGGDVSVVSSDDGINATASSGVGITFEGGKTYVYAGGDGLDANSRTSYQGIIFAGGEITVISTTSMNSSIDTEQGYTYTGGTVLALCPANGMGNEATKCQNFNSVGKKMTMNLKSGQTLTVRVGNAVAATAEMPCQLSALVIFLGSPSAEFEVK